MAGISRLRGLNPFSPEQTYLVSFTGAQSHKKMDLSRDFVQN
jgi:hypothetical protein